MSSISNLTILCYVLVKRQHMKEGDTLSHLLANAVLEDASEYVDFGTFRIS